jgi:pimeloyl-ACP methyl ester carboxylesterase
LGGVPGTTGPIETMTQTTSTEPFPVEHISIHGHQIGYRRGGWGPVVLLLHGIAGSSLTWVPAMTLLQSDYTVLAPDFLEHGASEKPPGDHSLGNVATVVRDLLDLLGIDRATVVGQSFDGGVAMQFSYQFPERCERLVLVDAGGLGREVNWILRLAALPGAEYVMPALFPTFVGNWGDSVVKFFGGRGFPNAQAVEMWRSYKSLTEGESRLLRPYHSVRDRPGRAVGERRGPPLPGRTHADTHRLG